MTGCLACCCCVKTHNRDDSNDFMLAEFSEPPSLFQRLFMCQCSPEKRTSARLEFQEQLRGLAGITIQDGDHSTAGTLLTLKWMKYDPQTRTGNLQVFGGFGGSASTGLWSEDPSKLPWYCLMNLGRCANYQYHFEWNEDFSFADISIKGNPLILCCICIPCVPAWFTIPHCCCNFSMKRTSDDGTSWDRYTSRGGGEPVYTYTLKTVYDTDGSKGPHFAAISKAPQQVMVTY